MMGSADFAEEIDCGSFFDQIDDLIDFPADNGCGLSSGADDFPNIWSNPSGCLPGSDPIFTGNNGNSASDLSAELSVPVSIIFIFHLRSTPFISTIFFKTRWRKG